MYITLLCEVEQTEAKLTNLWSLLSLWSRITLNKEW